jgi:2-polyprenyl-6-methoxyphenol hydroxylase-like FAD-dependent oxidoreductase
VVGADGLHSKVRAAMLEQVPGFKATVVKVRTDHFSSFFMLFVMPLLALVMWSSVVKVFITSSLLMQPVDPAHVHHTQ